MQKKASTEPYKGVRDFYPEDMAVQKYIFSVWREVCERYGFEEYGASLLEPAELYRAKSSEEIVNDQTYTFTDRGDREVTLRPEMTPSVARLVAARRRELAFPLRWYSVQNFFRYERPQRGRLREHWQLNADLFGVTGFAAEVEIISLAHDIMHAFGATDNDFEIRINNRGTMKASLLEQGLSEEEAEHQLSIADKKAGVIVGQETGEIKEIISALRARGITNARFDATLIRGFSYYTGTVFEVFDTNPTNNRSLFGGGRYDRLLEVFDAEPVPAIGFGMGDVTMHDFLETHGLLPAYTSTTSLMLCTVDPLYEVAAQKLADQLRAKNITVAVYVGEKKVGDQIKIALKKSIPFIVCVGKEEAESGMYKLKELATETETSLDASGIADYLHSKLGASR